MVIIWPHILCFRKYRSALVMWNFSTEMLSFREYYNYNFVTEGNETLRFALYSVCSCICLYFRHFVRPFVQFSFPHSNLSFPGLNFMKLIHNDRNHKSEFGQWAIYRFIVIVFFNLASFDIVTSHPYFVKLIFYDLNHDKQTEFEFGQWVIYRS